MPKVCLHSSLAIRACSVTALLLLGFSAHAQTVFVSSMGVGDVAHAANLTTNAGGQASTGALMPVSGYMDTAVPITQLDGNNSQPYFGNIYGGVLQVMPATMTFTKLNAVINPQNIHVLIGVRLTVTAQLYRFQRQGGSGQLVVVPGAACTFTDASTLGAPNPTQTYDNIVPPGQLGVCSTTFSATIPAGDSLMWLISMTASSTVGASLAQTLPIDASISLATQAAQTLIFGTAPTVAMNGTGSVNAISATPNSGNAIAYSTSSTDCSVTSVGVVTGVNAGANNCAIVATQGGDANYATGTATQTFSIGQAAQTLTFVTAPSVVVNDTGTVSATSASPSSGNPIAYSTSSTDCLATSTGVVTGINAGTNNCIIVATQVGNTNYAQGTATQTLSIGRANQTIAFPAQNPASHAFASNATFAITPLATSAAPNSNNAIAYSSLTGSVCSISTTAVTMLSIGTCTIAADQAGNGNYNNAVQVTQNVAISLTGQTISNFAASPASPTFAAGGTFTVSASGGASGNPVTFSIAPASTSVCSAGGLNGTTITMLGAGPCTILANQAGNASCAAATQATMAVTIAKTTTTTALATTCMTTFVGNQLFTSTAVVTGSSPAGGVTFNQGTSTLCSNVMLSSGNASCTTSTLATMGTDAKDNYTLTATYNGDPRNAVSISATLPVTVLSASDVVYRNGFDMGTLSCPVK